MSNDVSYIFDGIYVSGISVKTMQKQPELYIEQTTEYQKEMCSLDLTDEDLGPPKWMKNPEQNYFHIDLMDDLKREYIQGWNETVTESECLYALRSEKKFRIAVKWVIEKRALGHHVCINCMCGISRSGTVAIALVMQLKKMNFINALDFVIKQRDCVDPNYVFQAILRVGFGDEE